MKSYATKILVLLWVIGLCCSVPLHAQVAGATLTGTITDAQGGAVVNAKVSAKDGATGITSETNTNSTGNYNLVNLKPADYVVSVTATGFNTTTTKVTLTVGAQQELSLALKVGEMTQLVEITGAAPVIETENATLSGNVQSAQIVELPLNGRDWTSLAALEPGVQVDPGSPAPYLELLDRGCTESIGSRNDHGAALGLHPHRQFGHGRRFARSIDSGQHHHQGALGRDLHRALARGEKRGTRKTVGRARGNAQGRRGRGPR